MDRFDGYDGFVAEFYDLIPGYQGLKDLDFYIEWGRRGRGPVLELACGTGRVMIPLARAGLEVTGLDRSATMLSVCREKLLLEPEAVLSRVHLMMADMRSFKLGRIYSCVFVPFRSFQALLDVESQLECLASIHRHLGQDGVLVLHLFNPSLPLLVNRPLGEEIGDSPDFTMPDGRKVSLRARVVNRDLFDQRIESEMIYRILHPDGRREELVHVLRLKYLFRFEVEHLLARAGFAVEEVYSDFAGNRYGHSYPGELIVVARKS